MKLCSLNNINQELKSKKFSLEKIKDGPNVVRFYTGFENYDVLIAVCSQKLVGCIFGKAQTKAKMEHQNTNMIISINLHVKDTA